MQMGKSIQLLSAIFLSKGLKYQDKTAEQHGQVRVE
jgi:hypothetical protein